MPRFRDDILEHSAVPVAEPLEYFDQRRMPPQPPHGLSRLEMARLSMARRQATWTDGGGEPPGVPPGGGEPRRFYRVQTVEDLYEH